jgi:hypothetical protein
MVNTFALYKKNKQPPLFQISEHKKTKPYDMKIQTLVWDRHKNVLGNVFMIWL